MTNSSKSISYPAIRRWWTHLLMGIALMAL